jgi:cyclohexyl-isocyanide hydratase
VVRDGNLFTAGVDFALTMVAELAGPAAAQTIQLQIEYAPSPSFGAGTAQRAGRPARSRRRSAAATRSDRRAGRARLITNRQGR